MIDRYETLKGTEKDFLSDRPAMSLNNRDPEKIGRSIIGEAEELLEAITMYSFDQTFENLQEIGQEIADVIKYCLSLCFIFNLDMYDEVMTKTAYNHLRFKPSMFQTDYDEGYKESKRIAKELNIKEDYYNAGV